MLPEKTIHIVDEGAEVTKIEKWFPNELVFDKWFERSGYSDLVKIGTNKAEHLYAELEDGATYHAMSNSRVRMQNITSSSNGRRREDGDDDDRNSGGSNGSSGQRHSDGMGDPHEASAAPALAAVSASAAAEWDKVATRGAALLRRLWATMAAAVAALAAFWAHAVGALVETAAPQPEHAQQQRAQAPAASLTAARALQARPRARLRLSRAPVLGLGAVGCGAGCHLQPRSLHVRQGVQRQMVCSSRVGASPSAARPCLQSRLPRKMML